MSLFPTVNRKNAILFTYVILLTLIAVFISAVSNTEDQLKRKVKIKEKRATRFVLSDSLNIRSGPSTNDIVVGSLKRGQKFWIHKYELGWLRISAEKEAPRWVVGDSDHVGSRFSGYYVKGPNAEHSLCRALPYAGRFNSRPRKVEKGCLKFIEPSEEYVNEKPSHLTYSGLGLN